MYSDLMDEIMKAVEFKRQKRFKESYAIYEDLNSRFPNHPHVYKGWAKTLVADGYYEKAIESFQKAAVLFHSYGDESSAWQCVNHVEQLSDFKRNGFDEEDINFREYVKAVSGSSQELLINFRMPTIKK